MAPHPILMQVLHDDRSRRVTALLTRRSLLAHRGETPGAEPAPDRRRLGNRAIACLTMIFGRQQDKAAGKPI
jgi:hypothetical protein